MNGGSDGAGLAAVVLAGGESRRMGTPKPLLDWHGATLIERVTGILVRVAEPVVVVGGPGRPLPELAPESSRCADRLPGQGPLEGIAAGLRHVAGTAGGGLRLRGRPAAAASPLRAGAGRPPLTMAPTRWCR